MAGKKRKKKKQVSAATPPATEETVARVEEQPAAAPTAVTEVAEEPASHLARGAGSHWLRVWGVALLCFTILVVVHEQRLRQQGYRPNVVDNRDLWCMFRDRVYAGGEKTVVMVGASRIQLGFAKPVFKKWFPEHQLIPLAVDGSRGLPVLLDLANDPKFKGTILIAVTAAALMPEDNSLQQKWVDYYHEEWRTDRRVNRWVSLQFQQRLAFTYPIHSLMKTLYRVTNDKEPPPPFYLRTYGDRTRDADYRATNVNKHRSGREKQLIGVHKTWKPPSEEAWRDQVMTLKPAIDGLQKRGGKVVFLRFPTTGVHWLLDSKATPRQKYWDRLGALSGAPTIHFLDLPEARYLDCPDTSHLDRRDAPIFTAAVIREMMRRGLLPDRPMPADLMIPQRQFWPRDWRFKKGGRIVGQFIRKTDKRVLVMLPFKPSEFSDADNAYIATATMPAREGRVWTLKDQSFKGTLLNATPEEVQIGFSLNRATLSDYDNEYLDTLPPNAQAN